jgi:hypothetical protein
VENALIAGVVAIVAIGSGCGSAAEEPGSLSGPAAETATQTYLDELPTPEGGWHATPPPTVTPGGIPHGYDGFIIEGVVSITGAVSFESTFRYPVYSDPPASTCASYAEGVSRESARDQTEAIFYEMDRYIVLPTPHNPTSEWMGSNTPEPIARVWMAVRVMPYDGPGRYDQSSGVFVRPTPIEIPDDKPVPDIGFLPLPYIEIDGIAYSVLSDASTIVAEIAPDGSGSLTFHMIRSESDPSGAGVSGEMRWTCRNELGG